MSAFDHIRLIAASRPGSTSALRRAVAAAVTALSVSTALLLAACGSDGNAGATATATVNISSLLPADHDVQLVVTGTSSEERPELPPEGRALVEADGQAEMPAGSVTLLAVDGDGTVRPACFDLSPRRGTQVEQDPERRSAAAACSADTVAAAVRAVTASRPGHALLAGLQEAGRHDGGTIVAISSGIDTDDPLDLRKSGLDLSPSRLVSYLRSHDELLQLSGRTVVLALTPPAGRQPVLTESTRRHLEELWQAVVQAAGAKVVFVASGSDHPPAATAFVPPVPVPQITSLAGTTGSAASPAGPQVIPPGLLFEPALAVLLYPEDARRQLTVLAGQLRTAGPVTLIGHTALDQSGPAAGGELSLRRAQVVAGLLVQLEVPPARSPGWLVSDRLSRLSSRRITPATGSWWLPLGRSPDDR